MTPKVMYTEDLSVFKHAVNRPLNMKRCSDIAEDIADRKNMLAAYPVVVNERMEVIDGQHRIKAAEIAGVGMYYIVAEGFDVTDQAKANELTRSWSLVDWATVWANRKEDPNWREYRQLLDLAAEFPTVGFASLVNYTQFGGWNRESLKFDFKSGGFKIKDIDAARQLCKMHSDFRAANLPNTGGLAGAVVALFRNPEYDHSWMVRRLKQYPRDVTPCRDARDYLAMFQSLYNFDRPAKNRAHLVPA